MSDGPKAIYATIDGRQRTIDDPIAGPSISTVTCDAAGNLQVVAPAGAPLMTDIEQVRGVAASFNAEAGARTLGVAGMIPDPATVNTAVTLRGFQLAGRYWNSVDEPATLVSNAEGSSGWVRIDGRRRLVVVGARDHDDVAAGAPVMAGGIATYDPLASVNVNDACYLNTNLFGRLRTEVWGSHRTGWAYDILDAHTAYPVTVAGRYLAAGTAGLADTAISIPLLDQFGDLRISGAVAADDATATGRANAWPVVVGGIADEVLTAVANNDVAQLVTDLFRRLRTLPEGATADDAADTAALNPVKMGAIANATLAAVADGDMVHLLADPFRRLRVTPEGQVADDESELLGWYIANPLKMGAIADAVLTAVSDGDMAQLVTDLYRRLQVVIAGYDSGSNANRVFEVSPLNLQVLEESIIDTTNHAASAGVSYPSDDGVVMMGYKDMSLTGKFICGAGNTIDMDVEGTNDEDATPANRDWIVLYGYRSDTNTVVNTMACGAAATVTYAWDFDNINYRYVRLRFVVVTGGAASNTIIAKMRRKAL